MVVDIRGILIFGNALFSEFLRELLKNHMIYTWSEMCINKCDSIMTATWVYIYRTAMPMKT